MTLPVSCRRRHFFKKWEYGLFFPVFHSREPICKNTCLNMTVIVRKVELRIALNRVYYKCDKKCAFFRHEIYENVKSRCYKKEGEIMTKKLLCIVLCLIMVLSCFAGCGSTETEAPAENTTVAPAAEGTVSEEPVDKLRENEGTTITIAHNQGEYIYEKFYEMGDKFKELTGITVEWLEIPSSDWDTWVTAQYSAGTEPDIVWSMSTSGPQVARDYFDQGKILDLTPYYEQENVFNGKKWLDCFTENGLNNCMSNDSTKYIGTAVTFATVNLYYNKDAMADLGLGTTPPATYTEMFQMMETAKEDGTYIPMSVMNSMGWNLTWIENDIIDALFSDTDIVEKLDIIVPNQQLDDSEVLLGLKTGVLDYEDPRFVEYFNIMKNFSQYWNEDFNAASWEYEGLFNESKALFNFNGGWYPSQVIERDITVNYGTVQKPYVDSEFSEYGVDERILYVADSGECGFHISQKCADEGRADAAVKFLQFLTDAETGAKMYIDAVMLMTCVEGVEMPETMADLQNVTYGDAKVTNIIKAFKFNSEVGNMYWTAYTNYLDPATNQSAEDFVKQMKEDLLPFLDEAIEDYTTYDVLSYVDQVQ